MAVGVLGLRMRCAGFCGAGEIHVCVKKRVRIPVRTSPRPYGMGREVRDWVKPRNRWSCFSRRVFIRHTVFENVTEVCLFPLFCGVCGESDARLGWQGPAGGAVGGVWGGSRGAPGRFIR